MHFLANEPILVTASEEDNSLKMWFFEKGTTQPRILRERSGHASAPSRLRFYGGKDDPVNQGARNVVTSSGDGSLRDISLLNEFQSMKFSVKQLIKRGTEQGADTIGAIKHFDFCEFRERDWSNLLTCQDKSSTPHLWQTSNHSIAKI